MKQVRRSEQRGQTELGWLSSAHTFSFGGYFDPKHTEFGALRVINEDRVAPGQGFGTHPHNNMEIFSYVVSGELAHRDSMGNVHTIKAGEIQAMSAGSGVTHSEFNASRSEEVHFLQIWIVPNQRNITPSYSEWKPSGAIQDGLALVLSPEGDKGALKIHQDARVYLGKLQKGKSAELTLAKGRRAWLQMITGEVKVGEEVLSAGDGLGVTEEALVHAEALAESSFLLFDLA